MAGPKKVALIAGLYVLFVDLCVCQVWLLSLVVISWCAFLRLLFDIVLVREVGVGGTWFKVGAQVEAVKIGVGAMSLHCMLRQGFGFSFNDSSSRLAPARRFQGLRRGGCGF